MMSVEEKRALFEEAKKKREAEKEKEKSRGSFEPREYENIAYMALQTDAERVFRIVGNPLSMREKSTDPKLSYIAKIIGDNGKQFRCIFPDHETHKDWILWKIYDLILDGKWENHKKIYKYESIHPECFNRVFRNNSDSKYEKGWTPRAFVNLNVIDRSDMQWHKENKHTKLLSSRVSEVAKDDGESMFFYDPGIPRGCYNTIWDDVVEYAGLWDDYDIVVKKLDTDPYYKAFHSVDDAKKIKDEKIKSLIVEGPITEEELSWEAYDLDKFFAITSYNKIKSKLGNFIKKVDVDFGTHFTEELEKLCEEEKAKWEAEHKNDAEIKAETESKEFNKEEDFYDDEPMIPEAKVEEEEPVRERTSVRAETIDWNGLLDGSFNGTKYLGVAEMTEEEKAMVAGIESDGSFKYVSGVGPLYKDSKSGFKSPGAFHVDPLSGAIF